MGIFSVVENTDFLLNRTEIRLFTNENELHPTKSPDLSLLNYFLMSKMRITYDRTN